MNVKISNSERKFVEESIGQGIRVDGRGSFDFRALVVETNVLAQANGSSRVRIGGTDILVGVKLETSDPQPTKPLEGMVHFSVELSPSASSDLTDSRDVEAFNAELTGLLHRMVTGSKFDKKQLGLISGKLCWVAYVDVMVLDSEGNLFDAISIATRAALADTIVPAVIIDEENGEFDVDETKEGKRLNVNEVPVCVTFNKIGNGFVVDGILLEEECASARLTIGVSTNNSVCFIQKGSSGGIQPSSLNNLIGNALSIGKQLISKLDNILIDERKQRQLSNRSSKQRSSFLQ